MSHARWTRAIYASEARNYADATSADRWTATEVNYALGYAHAREWKRILNANRYARFGTRTVPQGATGLIVLSVLDSGSADTQERFYRVLDVTDGTSAYPEIQFADAPLPAVTGVSLFDRGWYLIGDNLQLTPASSGLAMTVYVNHTPTPIDQLAADASVAEFPRDYEPIVSLEAAARLLQKGAAESDAANVLQQQAESMRQDMLSDLARVSTNPLRMRYPDSRAEWGV